MKILFFGGEKCDLSVCFCSLPKLVMVFMLI